MDDISMNGSEFHFSGLEIFCVGLMIDLVASLYWFLGSWAIYYYLSHRFYSGYSPKFSCPYDWELERNSLTDASDLASF